MNGLWTFGLVLTWIAIFAGCWLGWQLLRQNGRMLLRLDELEKRLDELEFGEDEQPAGLPVGSAAPGFELPDLMGRRHTLSQYRGRPVLLILFNPSCGFCRELAPRLRLSQQPELNSQTDPAAGCEIAVVIITSGNAEQNRAFFSEQKLDYPVLLQRHGEVATAYKANGTPSGYVISSDGKIASRLAIGAEALLEIAREPYDSDQAGTNTSDTESSVSNGHGEDQSLVTSAATSRLSNASLARSKIKRDGLKAGTAAPDFRLPRLDGRGELSLSELRGRRVLLVFSSPGCGPCNTLAPELEKFYRQQMKREVGRVTPCASEAEMLLVGAHGVTRPTLGPLPISVVMISKGEPKENRAKVKEHKLTFPIVLQQQWEISRRYAMFATPIAYLIDEAGIITQGVAVGSDAILGLMARQQGEQSSASKSKPELIHSVAR
jgi:peroxiredoxin